MPTPHDFAGIGGQPNDKALGEGLAPARRELPGSNRIACSKLENEDAFALEKGKRVALRAPT